VPAARSQAFKDTPRGGGFVKVERLRIKLGSELFDPSLFHKVRPGCESLASLQIVEVKPLDRRPRLIQRVSAFTHCETAPQYPDFGSDAIKTL
jgi:hypothetical protein